MWHMTIFSSALIFTALISVGIARAMTMVAAGKRRRWHFDKMTRRWERGTRVTTNSGNIFIIIGMMRNSYADMRAFICRELRVCGPSSKLPTEFVKIPRQSTDATTNAIFDAAYIEFPRHYSRAYRHAAAGCSFPTLSAFHNAEQELIADAVLIFSQLPP